MVNEVIKIRKPDLPATKRQLWYLHILTGNDTRQLELTVLQANEAINTALNKRKKSNDDIEFKQVTDNETQLKIDGLTELIDNHGLKHLLPLWYRVQNRKDQNNDITLKEFQSLTGRQAIASQFIKIDQFKRQYIDFDNALDCIVNEMGFENTEALYNELGILAKYNDDLKSLKRGVVCQI